MEQNNHKSTEPSFISRSVLRLKCKGVKGLITAERQTNLFGQK